MKRLASFILAFIFLGSNLGLAMGTHFCGGHAMDAAVLLGHEELSCGMMPELLSDDTDHQHDQNFHSTPCCANEFQSLQIEDDFQTSLTKVFVQEAACLTPLFVIADFSNQFKESTAFQAYDLPVRTDDVTIILQVFRI